MIKYRMIVILFFVAVIGGCGAVQIKTSSTEKDKNNSPEVNEKSTPVKEASSAGAVAKTESEDAGKISADARNVYNDGVKAGAKGKINKAEKSFERAAKVDDKACQPVYNLGVVAERKGNDEDAENFYKKALSLRPDYDLAVWALSRLYIRKGKPEKAVDAARKAIQANAQSVSLLCALSNALISSKKYNDAIVTAKKALKIDERSAQAMLIIAKANYKMGRLELTDSILVQIMDIDPEIAEIYFLQALIALEKGHRLIAIKKFEMAISKNSYYVEALNNLAIQYTLAGNYKQAIAKLKLAIAISPSWAVLYMNMGNALRGAGQSSEALSALNKAREMDSTLTGVLFNVGVLYYTAGELGGLDRLARLKKAKDFFARYKNEKGHKLSSKDDANKYLKELNVLIQREQTRIERQKEAEKREAERAAQKAAAKDNKSDDNSTDDEGWDDAEDDGWE